MKTVIIAVLLALFIFPVSVGWAAPNIGDDDTLKVEVLSPYSYKAEDGSTVVIGEVQNKNNFPVTGVKLGVSFYDETGKTLEYKIGTTLLKVVPAGGKAPFSISSKQNPSITDISVNLAGFNSSPVRQQVLTVTPGTLEISDQLVLSGTIINGGTILTSGTTIYLISYDGFGRVVGIATTTPVPDDIGVGKTSIFTISSTPNPITKSYKLVVESDNYQSALTDVTNVETTISSLTKLVTISGTSVTDQAGNKYDTIPIGAQVKITSGIWLKFASDQSTEQPYVSYVQIKRIGGGVEFIGTAEGVFHGAEKQDVSVTWIPENEGAYYTEVYVWDPNAVALSSPSSMINVMLVK